MNRTLFLCISFLLISPSIFAQLGIGNTLYYIGPDGIWDDPMAWSYDNTTPCSCLPTINDDAKILNAVIVDVLPFIPPFGAQANSLEISNGAVLNINVDGSLTLEGANVNETFYIRSGATFNNSGTLQINGSEFKVIYNFGNINNEGLINLDANGNAFNGIDDYGTTVNNGEIVINSPGYGLITAKDCTFTNNGAIFINGDPDGGFLNTGIRHNMGNFHNYGIVEIININTGIELHNFGDPSVIPEFINHTDAIITVINNRGNGVSWVEDDGINVPFVNEEGSTFLLNSNGLAQPLCGSCPPYYLLEVNAEEDFEANENFEVK